MVKKSVKKCTRKTAPVKTVPANPQLPAPVISNEQYLINVLTTRCKTLEIQVMALVKEVASLQTAKEAKDGGN